MRLVRNECTQLSAAVRCHSISVCRGGGGEELCGEELCQMLPVYVHANVINISKYVF